MDKLIKKLKYITLFNPLIVIFFLLEIFFRNSKLTPILTENKMFSPDSILPYVGKPDKVFIGTNPTNEFNYHYKHNSLGFRDCEHNLTNERTS